MEEHPAKKNRHDWEWFISKAHRYLSFGLLLFIILSIVTGIVTTILGRPIFTPSSVVVVLLLVPAYIFSILLEAYHTAGLLTTTKALYEDFLEDTTETPKPK